MVAKVERVCSAVQEHFLAQFAIRMDQMCAAVRPEDKEAMKADAAEAWWNSSGWRRSSF